MSTTITKSACLRNPERGEAPARQRQGLDSAPQDSTEKGIFMIARDSQVVTGTTIPQPRQGDEVSCPAWCSDHDASGMVAGHYADPPRPAGRHVYAALFQDHPAADAQPLIYMDADNGLSLSEALTLADQLVALVRQIEASAPPRRPAEIVPLDPTIGPFDVDSNWRSDAAAAARKQFDKLQVKGSVCRSLPEYEALDHFIRQERADCAALAARVPITPCPSWCVQSAGHAWESEEVGLYFRDHLAESPVYGDGMALRWMEAPGWMDDNRPYIQFNDPAIDYPPDGVTVENAAMFAVELSKLAESAGGAE